MSLRPDEVAEVLSKAAATDGSITVDEATVMAWTDALADLRTLDRVTALQAVTDHTRHSRFAMTVAEFRDAVKRVRDRREVEESRARALTAAPSAPAQDMWRDAHWDLPWFQEARMRARIRWCEEHGVPHDGDGWTAADRPSTALGGRVTAFDWR